MKLFVALALMVTLVSGGGCTAESTGHTGDGRVSTGDAGSSERIGFVDGGARDGDGSMQSDGIVDVGRGPDASIDVPPACQQDPGLLGIVSLEAECFHQRVSQGAHSWAYNGIGGHFGFAAMRAVPDIDGLRESTDVGNSPRLDYVINFVRTGTHYIWIRGLADDDEDDSCHLGFDGNALATTVDVTEFGQVSAYGSSFGQWHWSSYNNDEVRLTIDVTTPGEHTLNLWMREDGFFADKIVLTTSEAYEPPEDDGEDLSPQACQCPLCGNGTLDPSEECEAPFGECCDPVFCQHIEDGTLCSHGVCQQGTCVAGGGD